MDDLRARFGRLVVAHRRRKGLTQEGLASATGLSVDMIARMEAGRTGARFPTLEKLATVFGIDPAELFTAELPNGALKRKALSDLTARLARLSDKDLEWVGTLLDAALKSRP